MNTYISELLDKIIKISLEISETDQLIELESTYIKKEEKKKNGGHAKQENSELCVFSTNPWAKSPLTIERDSELIFCGWENSKALSHKHPLYLINCQRCFAHRSLSYSTVFSTMINDFVILLIHSNTMKYLNATFPLNPFKTKGPLAHFLNISYQCKHAMHSFLWLFLSLSTI